MIQESVLDRAMELPGAKRYSHSVWVICPFHDDRKPSLAIYQDYARCSACGWHGLPELVFKASQRSTIFDVVDTRADRSELPYIQRGTDPMTFALRAARRLVNTPVALSYLAGRGIQRSAATRYRIGWYDGWVTVPVLDREENVLNIMFRSGPSVQPDTRFWQWPGVKPFMYVPDWKQLEEAHVIFITFGIFDAITCSMLGYPSCTSTIGKDSFNPAWLDLFRVPIVIVPDAGEEGSAVRLASKLGWRGSVLKLKYPDGTKDPNDYVQTKRTKQLTKELSAWSSSHR